MEFILESSLLIGILYSFYKLFLQKETFFKSIRIYFIIGILITIVFPLTIIPIYVEVNNEMVSFVPQVLENNITTTESNIAIIGQEFIKNKLSFNWLLLFKTIYLLGIAFFSLKFFIEIISLYKLVHKSNKQKKGNITFAETLKNISPFSIFNYIVYNKNLFNKQELLQIIEHEKVHVNHKHSYDMLLVHLLVIVQWFNPFAWLYKKNVEQNLEFLADKFAQENHDTLKEYQYLLLKTSIQKNPFALSTNFYNSLIKKRIIMLQKNRSKKLNQLKYVLLLPLFVVFLYAFNTKEVITPIPIEEETIFNLDFSENDNQNNKFINPIHSKNIIRVSSNYGKRKNPITKKEQFHNGIDLIATINTEIYATKNGEVITATNDLKKGNYIQIKHANNFQTNYHHLNHLKIKKGDKVVAGQLIGTVGSTGKSTGPHLHYEVMKDDKNIDPINFIDVNKKSFKTIKSKIVKSNNDFNKKIIELIITKNSTKKGLVKIKKILEKESVKISFKKIKRNKQNEIIAIQINASNKESKVNYSTTNDKGINQITIKLDGKNIAIGNSNKHTIHYYGNQKESIHIDTDYKKHKKKKKHSISIHEDHDNDSHSNVFIVEGNEHGTYIVNGKKMSKEAFEKMSKSNNTFINHSSENSNVVFITHDEDEDSGNVHKTIRIHKKKNGDNSNLFYEIDDNDKNTITTYIVNGKKMSKEEFKKFDKDKIQDLKIEKTKEVIKKEE